MKVDPDDDSVFVGDRGHMEAVLYNDIDKEGLPMKYLHATMQEGEAAYMASRVPLHVYLDHANILGISLPEVTITRPVLMERTAVSLQQPLLEERLTRYPASGGTHQDLVAAINRIDELRPWYSDYLERQQGEQRDRGAVSRERG